MKKVDIDSILSELGDREAGPDGIASSIKTRELAISDLSHITGGLDKGETCATGNTRCNMGGWYEIDDCTQEYIVTC